MSARIEDGAARRAYVLGGDAYFTLVGREARFTYRVQAAKSNIEPGSLKVWFVSVLTGPDNSSNYALIGTIRDAPTVGDYRARWAAIEASGQLAFRHARNAKIGEDASSVVAFKWTFRHLHDLGAHGAEFWHCGRCSRCGRMLTDPTSIRTGLGPVCSEKAA